MLQGTGPYGPNETPLGMGGAINMSQSNTPINFAQNINNMSKTSHQRPQVPNTQCNLPDYPSYNHVPLNMGSQINSFPTYHPSTNMSHYMPPISSNFNETGWQSGMYPMNLNTQHSNEHLLNYLAPLENRHSNYNTSFEDHYQGKNLPINIPQVPPKVLQKSYNDNYHLYNEVTNSKTENEQQNILKVNNDELKVNNDGHKMNNDEQNSTKEKVKEKFILDGSKRKSLENTVKLIEDLLMNTSKKATNTQETTHLDTPNNITEKQNESDIAANKESNNYTPRKTILSQLLEEKSREVERVFKKTELVAKTTEENKSNDNNKHDPLQLEDNQSGTESLCVVKLEVDNEPTIQIKIENMYWTDTEYMNPFHRDIHGKMRDDVMESNIIDCDNSVNEATVAIKSGMKSNSYYECPHCTLIFEDPKRFLIHNKWHSFGLINERRTEIARERQLSRNLRKEVRILDRMNSKEVQDPTASEDNIYQCNKCEKAFSTKGSLKNHKQRFHPTRVRECKICGETAIGWLALRDHVQSHAPMQRYQCPECPKNFKYAHSLAKHRDTHLEKTVSCEQCPKKFGSLAQLKLHMKCHERAQRGAIYQCSYCAKSFYEAYSLSVHERTHRNERPYLCEICNTSYGTNSSLKRHLKVSHSEAKPFSCSICHRNFISERIRDRHEARIHAKPTDFKFTCDQCPCKYLKLKDLKKHVNKAHPKTKRKKKVPEKEVDEPSVSWVISSKMCEK